MIDDVLSVFQGKVIARSGDELFQADPSLVAELAPLKDVQPDVFAFESLKAATLRPSDFDWQPFPCSNPHMVATELKFEARWRWGFPYRTRKPTPA
jgi:hypothetical protein